MIKETFKKGKGKKAICVCDFCGEEFYRNYSIAIKTKLHFCSMDCDGKRFPPKKFTLTCSHCGKYFEISLGEVDRRKKIHFCSTGCNINYCFENNLPITDPHWNGLRVMDSNGYIKLFVAENSENVAHYVMEHRYTMEQHIGRKLYPKESVHHKNGQREDNRIKNLELWSFSHPRGQRTEEKIEWAIEFLNQYGYNITKLNEVKND